MYNSVVENWARRAAGVTETDKHTDRQTDRPDKGSIGSVDQSVSD